MQRLHALARGVKVTATIGTGTSVTTVAASLRHSRRCAASTTTTATSTNASSSPDAQEKSSLKGNPQQSANDHGHGTTDETREVLSSYGVSSLDAVDDAALAKDIKEATENLRSAIQAWSEVERKKATSAAVVSTQEVRDKKQRDGSNKVPTPSVKGSGSAAEQPEPQTPSTTKSATTSTFSWIRDKKPKFWEGLVYSDSNKAAPTGAGPSATPAAAAAAANTTDTTPPPPTAASGSPIPAGIGTSASTAAGTVEQSSVSSPSSTNAATPRTSSSSSAQTAASIRMPTRDPIKPFRNRFKRDVARRLSELLDRDPDLGPILLEQLSAESRRLLLVMGTASEYFGENYQELVEQVKAADKDKDNAISGHEFDQWALNSFKKRHASYMEANTREGEEERLKKKDGSGTSAHTQTHLPTEEAATKGSVARDAVSPASLTATEAKSKKVNPIVRAMQAHPDRSSANAASGDASVAPPASASSSGRPASVSVGAQGSTTTASPSVASPSPTELDSAFETISAYATLQYAQSLKNGVVDAFAQAFENAGREEKSAGQNASGAGEARAEGRQEKVEAAKQQQQGKAKKGRTSSADKKADPSYIPWPTYRRLLIAAAAPFMAFGILDNSTLVLAGDAVDRYVSEYLNLSEMAAAAVGGVVSGVAGIQVHGLAERWTRSTPPRLTAAQHRSRAYFNSERIGNTLGMVIGLMIGMTPLLFIGGGTEEEVEEDHELLQKEADRTRQQRRQRGEVVRAETKERGLVEFEERESRKTMMKGFVEEGDHGKAGV